MQKAAFGILGALPIAGSAVQMAAASEHHMRTGRGHHRWDRAYNQLSEPGFPIPQMRDGKPGANETRSCDRFCCYPELIQGVARWLSYPRGSTLEQPLGRRTRVAEGPLVTKVTRIFESTYRPPSIRYLLRFYSSLSFSGHLGHLPLLTHWSATKIRR